MRVWDINAGYLNNQSLLGQHNEIHAIFSILKNGKSGYSHHPETLRWENCLWGLKKRHDLTVEEMFLRGFQHRSPLECNEKLYSWPKNFIDSPDKQFDIIKKKYAEKHQGRIPVPKNIQELWAQHKYSVMARDPEYYSQAGNVISKKKISFYDFAVILISMLSTGFNSECLQNTLEHMWGYVKGFAKEKEKRLYRDNPMLLLKMIQELTVKNNVRYLLESTALSEIAGWI